METALSISMSIQEDVMHANAANRFLQFACGLAASSPLWKCARDRNRRYFIGQFIGTPSSFRRTIATTIAGTRGGKGEEEQERGKGTV